MSGFLGIPWRVLVTRDYWQRAAVLALYAEGHIRWWEPWSTTWRDLTEVMGLTKYQTRKEIEALVEEGVVLIERRPRGLRIRVLRCDESPQTGSGHNSVATQSDLSRNSVTTQSGLSRNSVTTEVDGERIDRDPQTDLSHNSVATQSGLGHNSVATRTGLSPNSALSIRSKNQNQNHNMGGRGSSRPAPRWWLIGRDRLAAWAALARHQDRGTWAEVVEDLNRDVRQYEGDRPVELIVRDALAMTQAPDWYRFKAAKREEFAHIRREFEDAVIALQGQPLRGGGES